MNVRTSPLTTGRTHSFTHKEIQLMLDNLDTYTHAEQTEILKTLEELERQKRYDSAYNDLIEFCKHIFPEYKVGKHHRKLADLLMRLADPEDVLDRAAVNVPPRHGKSMLVSIGYVVWYLGRNPTKKIMMVSHTTDLAVDFGRKVRNLVASKEYREIFPNVQLAPDSKSAGRWNTNHGGEYFACGVGSALAGRGADLLLLDDPHSEQDILAGNYDVFDRAYEWFTFGARTRLMPKGAIAVVQTRWHMGDLTGRLTKDGALNEEADKYEVFEFPAIFEIEQDYWEDWDGKEVEVTDPEDTKGMFKKTRVVEKALWPEFFDLEALHRTKASMPLFQWNAQYQQNPTGEESSIIKKAWFKAWSEEKPPKCEYVISTLDAAAEKHNRADYTGLTTWGVFFNEEDGFNHIILLDSVKQRLEYPELKELAVAHYAEWEPDSFIVEKKSSGTPLYQELRRTGVIVSEYTPARGTSNNPNTKTARLNSISDIVKSGLVWVPETRWAEELVEEVSGFPFMRNDDLVDCMIMALMRFRNGGFIRLPSDEADEIQYFKQRKGKYY